MSCKYACICINNCLFCTSRQEEEYEGQQKICLMIYMESKGDKR